MGVILYFRFLVNYAEEGLGSALGTCRCILPGGKANTVERNRTKGAGAMGGTSSKPGRWRKAAAFYQLWSTHTLNG